MRLTSSSPTYYIYPEDKPGVVITITCAKLQDAFASARSLGHTPCKVDDHYENRSYFLDTKGKVKKVEENLD